MATGTASPSLSELALQQLPFPVLLLDPQRRVLSANAAAGAVLRQKPAELQGQELTRLIRSEDDTWCSMDPVDRLGNPSIGQKIVAKVGGAKRTLRVGVYPVRDAEDEDVGLLVTVRDAGADERDPHEEKDHLTSLGELSAIVAHEIRNPLTGIRTTVQFVDSKLGPEDARHEDLQEVIKEIDRIEQIIGNLLLFARPVEGNRALGDLNHLVERVLDGMAKHFQEAEIELDRSLSDELPPFVFSADNIQQVLLNLVRNAVEAMPEWGKMRVRTTLRRYRGDRAPSAEIYVSDNGPGIPEDLLDSIFKPFFTTRHNGTGLGLPISAGIVRVHGGGMSVRNRPDGGATFRVSLPVVLEEAGAL